MGKLYVIALGGTGARVIRSLTLLMAAGVHFSKQEIVPIVIDSDQENGDLKRSLSLLNAYYQISQELNRSEMREPSLFVTRLTRLTPNFMPPFPEHIYHKTLYELLGIEKMRSSEQLCDDNCSLLSSLFSAEEKGKQVHQGFEGNSKLGSILFQEFVSEEFQRLLCQNFEEGDEFFLIGSTFGGTGSAALPQLIDLLRHISDTKYPNASLIRNSKIGALYVLPYFKVEQSEYSPIDSFTFVSNSKATLQYYQGGGINDCLDYLYTLGDEVGKSAYPHHQGGENQCNKAHFVEMAAALAVVHFSQQPLSETSWSKRFMRYMEFGVRNDEEVLTFKDLARTTTQFIQRPMIAYYIFSRFIVHSPYLEQEEWKQKIDLTHNELMVYLQELSSGYIEWLNELATNSRAFAPFYLDTTGENLFHFIKNVPAHQSFWLDKIFRIDGYKYINTMFHKFFKPGKNRSSVAQQFVQLANESINQIIYEKYYH